MKKLLAAVTVLAVSTAQAGVIRYVDDDADLGGDGLAWDTAYVFLQDALADAIASDGAVTEIAVAQGRYTPDQDEAGRVMPGDRSATLQLISGVSLQGGYAGIGAADPNDHDPGLYITTLSGDLAGDDGPEFVNNAENSFHVVTGSGVDSTAILEGFHVVAGHANGLVGDKSAAGLRNVNGSPTIRICTFAGNFAVEVGGGMRNDDGANPSISQCTFIENAAFLGGGVGNTFASAVITDCVFIQNEVDSLGGGAGAGIYSHGSDPIVTNCLFEENRGNAFFSRSGSLPTLIRCQFVNNIAFRAAALDSRGSWSTVIDCTFVGNISDNPFGFPGGGAVSVFDASVFVRCSFVANSSATVGGALLLESSGDCMFVECVFEGNSAESSGGAICIDSTSRPSLINCLFVDNSSGADGGAIANLTRSNARVTGCVFSGNSAVRGGAMSYENCNPILTNCTFTGNSAVNGRAFSFDTRNPCCSSDLILTNSILWDGANAISNKDESTLTITHTDVQGGFPGTGNIDADPLFVDPNNGDFRLSPGSPCIDAGHNWAIAGITDTDLDGNPRFADDPATTDPGCGIPVVVDMGAYEYQGDPFPVKFGDTNGDGVVGINDFLDLLADWGPCEPGCCLADLDIDGDVGIADFLILLGNWG